jgi:hypothetical protein
MSADFDAGQLPEYFDSLGGCMQMLLLQGTFLDDVTDVLDVVYPVSPPLYFLFIFFIFLSAYAVINLLVGILVDVVARVRMTEQNQALAFNLRATLFEILELHDKDGDRMVAADEWDLIMSNPEMHLILKRCRVNIKHLMDLKEVLFEPEGTLESTKDFEHLDSQKTALGFEEFLEVILRLRGSTTATVSDIVDLRQYIQQRIDHLHFRIRKSGHAMAKANATYSSAAAASGNSFENSTIDLNVQATGSLNVQATESEALSRGSSATASIGLQDAVGSQPSRDFAPPLPRDGGNSEPPAWAKEILIQLGSLSAKHDSLHSEVAELRAQFCRAGLANDGPIESPMAVRHLQSASAGLAASSSSVGIRVDDGAAGQPEVDRVTTLLPPEYQARAEEPDEWA